MPELLTEITEIVTGLGMLGHDSVDEALASRPAALKKVKADHWARLDAARSDNLHAAAFDAAWENGRLFLRSADGLRDRLPALIEWKGPHRPPGFDLIPADLRVDHVYLVSCKYQSKILSNSSPSNLFDRRLADRVAGGGRESWYSTCAPDAFEHFYSCVRRHVGQHLLPTARKTCNRATSDASATPAGEHGLHALRRCGPSFHSRYRRPRLTVGLSSCQPLHAARR